MNIKKNILAIALLIAFSVSLMYDRQISLFFQTMRNLPLDTIFMVFTYAGSMIAVLFLILSFAMWKPKTRKWIVPFWLSLGVSVLVTYAIKALVERPRPEAIGIIAITAGVGFSFPSAHASASFSALPVLGKAYRKWMAAWVIIAVIISISRVYLGVHYMSDVIAGAAIGYCAGLICVKLADSSWFRRLNFLGR